MITIVSGLPRSGTSLMMQILESNGFDILTDNIRQADENNLKGYYEYEKVKSLIKDNSWLKEAKGKAVKVISQLVPFLPKDFEYRIIFMERNIDEVLASQSKMLDRMGSQKQAPVEILKKTFSQQVEKTKNHINNSPNMTFSLVNFNQLFNNPEKEISSINLELQLDLSVDKSLQIIQPSLYREKLYS